MNRLKDSTSPYLLQHADNPVDWWPWCDEAFAEAARRDVPVMLSVGYAACHWCHVMAHESFEDPETAALLNEHVVAVKVDREERPDVDAVYMTATQAMTGQGGWPMTVFMTPDKEPFFCGTYFPRDHFRQLVLSISRAWRTQHDGVTDQARQVVTALREHAEATARALREGESQSAERLPELGDAAVVALQRDYDAADGGFGGAPKFPPSMVLEFLLRFRRRTGSPEALWMAEGTCEAMARGGVYDQLGGGFARYSVDASWIVPHFEKMLYDNALLARVYLNLWRATGSELGRRVAAETCAWLLRELRTRDGGFAASLDADSEGEEGKFYVWRPAELNAVLGPADGEWAARVFDVTPAGTFERGASVLQRRIEPDDDERLERVRAALLAARGERVRPGRDDKVVAAWNGLAISALAECGLLLGRAEFVAAARDAATLLATVHRAGDRLIRTSRDGSAGDTAGVLEDYACVAEGFLVLSGVTGEGRWMTRAGELLGTALAEFGDGHGGFYDTAADGERLFYRPADPADNATPSGTFAVAGALLSYAALTGSARHREAAGAALGVLPAVAARYPRAAGAGLAVAEAWLAGPPEIAVVGDPGDERTRALHETALHAAPPGAVLALGDGAEPVAGTAPLLAGRGLVNGAPAAYVCRQFTCQAPVTAPEELTRVLAAPY
ncbi:MAG TPA: thioredoxin domain-containing protein [Streptosporangiaceae bacterium]|nr:thioredoxin domain-containing protein [Streptosporangiaceae bacterium]